MRLLSGRASTSPRHHVRPGRSSSSFFFGVRDCCVATLRSLLTPFRPFVPSRGLRGRRRAPVTAFSQFSSASSPLGGGQDNTTDEIETGHERGSREEGGAAQVKGRVCERRCRCLLTSRVGVSYTVGTAVSLKCTRIIRRNIYYTYDCCTCMYVSSSRRRGEETSSLHFHDTFTKQQ